VGVVVPHQLLVALTLPVPWFSSPYLLLLVMLFWLMAAEELRRYIPLALLFMVLVVMVLLDELSRLIPCAVLLFMLLADMVLDEELLRYKPFKLPFMVFPG
jgi:hypothetical protein